MRRTQPSTKGRIDATSLTHQENTVLWALFPGTKRSGPLGGMGVPHCKFLYQCQVSWLWMQCTSSVSLTEMPWCDSKIRLGPVRRGVGLGEEKIEMTLVAAVVSEIGAERIGLALADSSWPYRPRFDVLVHRDTGVGQTGDGSRRDHRAARDSTTSWWLKILSLQLPGSLVPGIVFRSTRVVRVEIKRSLPRTRGDGGVRCYSRVESRGKCVTACAVIPQSVG